MRSSVESHLPVSEFSSTRVVYAYICVYVYLSLSLYIYIYIYIYIILYIICADVVLLTTSSTRYAETSKSTAAAPAHDVIVQRSTSEGLARSYVLRSKKLTAHRSHHQTRTSMRGYGSNDSMPISEARFDAQQPIKLMHQLEATTRNITAPPKQNSAEASDRLGQRGASFLDALDVDAPGMIHRPPKGGGSEKGAPTNKYFNITFMQLLNHLKVCVCLIPLFGATLGGRRTISERAISETFAAAAFSRAAAITLNSSTIKCLTT